MTRTQQWHRFYILQSDMTYSALLTVMHHLTFDIDSNIKYIRHMSNYSLSLYIVTVLWNSEITAVWWSRLQHSTKVSNFHSKQSQSHHDRYDTIWANKNKDKPENSHFQMHTDNGTSLSSGWTDNWLLHHSTYSSCISVSTTHHFFTRLITYCITNC